MGYAFERQGKAGQMRYTAVYRDLKGRLRSAGTYSTRKKAEDEARIAERAASEGRMPDRKRGRQTLRQYVLQDWFPHHVIEATTRENYTYLLNKYILPELGDMRIIEILPLDIREWIIRLQEVHGLNPPTIRLCKAVLDGAFTTALNDRIVFLHPGKGVKVPTVAKKTKRIITVEQFDAIHDALGDDTMRLLVETDIESGLRWGELTELRPKDLDQATGMLTISRVVVHLKAKNRPDGVDFVVKNYPKDKEWRHVKLAPAILAKLTDHITRHHLGPDDLLFPMPDGSRPRRRTRPAELPNPDTLGLTEPNTKGKQYRHGTTSAYTAGRCRCQYCRDAVATYRANRRANGKDSPRTPRTVTTDGHIGNDWFRANIWTKALHTARIGFHITPHGLRHAHASWLLAGGADLLVVKERLGHGSITTTEQYLHTLPGAHDAALAALDAVRGARQNVPESEPRQRQAELPATTITAHDDELAQMRQMLTEMKHLLERGTSTG